MEERNIVSDTVYYRSESEKYSDMDMLIEKVIDKLSSRNEAWKNTIKEIMVKSGCGIRDYDKFAELIGGIKGKSISSGWLSQCKIPKRDILIKICFIAGYDVQETNKFLQRFGDNPPLYVKNSKDVVYMYALGRNKTKHRISYEECEQIIEKMANDEPKQSKVRVKKGSLLEANIFSADTLDLLESLDNVSDEEDLKRFITENSILFKKRYTRLSKKIKAYVNLNLVEPNSIDEVSGKTKNYTLYSIGKAENWPESLYHYANDISKEKWVPEREKLIALGIRLAMDIKILNEMLDEAGLEPLGSKSTTESAIIFAVTNSFEKGVVKILPDNTRYGAWLLTEEVRVVLKELRDKGKICDPLADAMIDNYLVGAYETRKYAEKIIVQKGKEYGYIS